MGSIELTPETDRRIELLFEPGQRDAVRRILLEQCGTNIPAWQSAGLERLHFAVLKLSGGNVAKLQEAVGFAKRDFRDVLVWAEFGEPGAHMRWLPAQK